MRLRPLVLLPAILALGCASTPPTAAGPTPMPTSAPVAPPASFAPAEVSTVPGKHDTLNFAVDRQGRIYTLDVETVNRIEPDGTTTRFLGPGSPDANDTTVSLPSALAFAPDGTAYALGEFDRLYKLSADGKVLASVAIPRTDWISTPGLAVDSHGACYMAVNSEFYSGPDQGDAYVLRWDGSGATSVVAGKPGVAGYADGVGQEARFRQPGQLAFDAQDNLYVADRGNLSIRRITPAGVVTTVAGKGAPQLPMSPPPGMPSPDLSPLYQGTVPLWGLAVTPAGELFYSASDRRIHRITPDGTEGVYAGDGALCPPLRPCQESCQPTPDPNGCFKDGPLAQAEFNGPTALLADGNGRLLVLDGRQNSMPSRIRVVGGLAQGRGPGPLAVKATLPSPPAPASPMPSPSPTPDLVHPSCGPYAACGQAGGQAFDQAGQPVTTALEVLLAPPGHPEQAQKVADAVDGRFSFTTAPQAGMLIVRGPGYAARQRPLTRGYSDQGYGGGPNPPPVYNFGGPASSADPDAPAFYLPPVGMSGAFREVSPVQPFEHATVSTLNPTARIEAGALAVRPDGTVVYLETQNNAVTQLSPDGARSVLAGGPYPQPYGNEQYLLDGQGGAAHFYLPEGLALGADGTAYVADSGNSAIRKVAPDGTVTTLAGRRPYGFADGKGADALFWGPANVAVAADGTVTTFGSNVAGYARDRFRAPRGIAVGPDGAVYVGDGGNYRLRRIAPSGEVTDLYGTPTNDPDGTAVIPLRLDLNELAVGADGTVYIASENRVYQLAPGGALTILAGYGLYGDADGPSDKAMFSQIAGLAVGPGGALYVADASNGRIRKVAR
jgi:sugar lactone lactonase YvrE